MEITTFFNQLDDLYRRGESKSAETFLLESLVRSIQDRENENCLTVTNELIGYYRVQGNYPVCRDYCRQALSLITRMELKDSLPYATMLLNIANAYRVMGNLTEAGECFLAAEHIYTAQLPADDYRIAGLCNNYSLLLQEQKDFPEAVRYLERALGIVSQKPDAYIETAVSHTNLAIALMKMKDYEAALSHLGHAKELFESHRATSDLHYAAVLSALGQAAYAAGSYEEAADRYKNAAAVLKAAVGETRNCAILYRNIADIYRRTAKFEEAGEAEETARQILERLDRSETDGGELI